MIVSIKKEESNEMENGGYIMRIDEPGVYVLNTRIPITGQYMNKCVTEDDLIDFVVGIIHALKEIKKETLGKELRDIEKRVKEELEK
jgi:hypothetical protein